MSMYNSIFVLDSKPAFAVDTEKETLVTELIRHLSQDWAVRADEAKASGEPFDVKEEAIKTLEMLGVQKKVLGDDVRILNFNVVQDD